jgi:2,4-dienoyl-CoA reductase-like NADH-dependent reductase (Old Yellow Enzyme family)
MVRISNPWTAPIEFSPTISGVHRATKHDILETYRPYVENAKFVLNSSILPDEGEELVASCKIDAISIGFNWITHPDLVKRVEHGKPLDNIPDIPHLQTKASDDNWSKGYTDYPIAVY